MTEETQEQVQEQTQEQEQETKKPAAGSSFYKEKLQKLEQENAKYQQMLEEQKAQTLQEKQNYKELWEIEKNKRTEAEQKAMKISQNYLTGLKMSAIEQEALKQGILPEALGDIRPDEATMVEIETGDRGTVNILGVSEYVEQLKETKRHWFKQSPPNVNTQNPNAGNLTPSPMSPSELVSLQKKDPAKYQEEMARRLKLA